MKVRKFSRAKTPPLPSSSIRALVRHRDGYRCQGCGMTAIEHIEKYGRTLDVHRIVPGSPYTIKGCTALCRTCHGPQPRLKSGDQNSEKITVSPPKRLRQAIRKLAAKERRKVAQLLVLLVEEAMVTRGEYVREEVSA